MCERKREKIIYIARIVSILIRLVGVCILIYSLYYSPSLLLCYNNNMHALGLRLPLCTVCTIASPLTSHVILPVAI